MHKRTDFTEQSFPIFAIGAGIVRSITDEVVLIEYDDGRFSRLYHLFDIEVAVGQRVADGQQIGRGR